MIKKFIKAIVKVLLVFVGLFAILIAVILADQKIAESRANTFCEAASKMQSIDEIKQLITQTKGIDSPSFTDEIIVALFPQLLPEYYACVIYLNENKKPIKYVVNHKD